MGKSRILFAMPFFMLAIACHKPKGNLEPVVSPIQPVNPKQYTAKMDGVHNWVDTMRIHCVSCTPPYDTTSTGISRFRIVVLDSSTFYEGDLNYPLPLIYPDPSNSYKYMHYKWHDSVGKYIYFENENTLSYSHLTMWAKYFYEKNRIEWHKLQVDNLDTISSVNVSD